jgi:hypothetical protein
MKRLAILFALLFAAAAPAQDLPLKIGGAGVKDVEIDRQIIVKVKVKQADKLPITIEAEDGAAAYLWTIPEGVTFEADVFDNVAKITAAPPGWLDVSVRYRMALVKDGKIVYDVRKAKASVLIGPDVPKPPDPKPPIPGGAFRVMIVYETSAALPSGQQAIITGKAIRDYLAAKTVPTPDGGKRGWYIADKDADFSQESKTWRDMLARPRTQIPWIIITTATASYEGPLPPDVASTLQLLTKFGG